MYGILDYFFKKSRKHILNFKGFLQSFFYDWWYKKLLNSRRYFFYTDEDAKNSKSNLSCLEWKFSNTYGSTKHIIFAWIIILCLWERKKIYRQFCYIQEVEIKISKYEKGIFFSKFGKPQDFKNIAGHISYIFEGATKIKNLMNNHYTL